MDDATIIDTLLRALADSSDEHLEQLRGVLADDVSGTGLFVAAAGADAFVEAVQNPPVPVLAMAEYGSPEPDGDRYVVEGTLPPGLPLAAVRLLIGVRDGHLTELIQEVVPAAPPAEDGMEIDEATAAFVDSAFDRSSPFVLCYVDRDGVPHVSFRGTLQSHGPDTLALWVRDVNGGLLRAIADNPHVALLGSDHATRTHYEIGGRARVTDDPEERERIFGRSPEHERNVDPAKRGVAVVIDVDLLRGGPMGAGVHRRRAVTGSSDGA